MADLARLRILVDSRDARSAATDLKALGNEASTTEGSASRLNSVFTKTNAVLAGLGIALGQALKAARDFERSMAEVATLIDTSVVSIDELSAAARNQAIAFGGDVQTQARALYQIISAGASTAAEANDILTASNKLAVGGVTDVAIAADGLTSVMNAYGPSVGNATQVSDAMFVAMRAGKTTIGELSASLGAVAPLAAQMGVSFDELTAATAALTKGGVSTSVAMTGLRAILAAVAKPSSEAAKLAKQLGLEFNTAAIQSKGLAGFMEELRVKTGGSQDALAKLFGGVEALVPVLALTGAAGQDLNDILDQQASKAGTTEDAVKKMSQTFDMQFNKAVANVKDLLLQLGLVLQATVLPVLTAFNNNLGTITTVLGGLIAATATYISLQALTAASTALVASRFALQAAAAISSAVAIGGLASAKMLLATAATAAGGAVRALTLALIPNPFTAAAAAVGILVGAMISLGGEQRKARQETDNLINSLAGLARARSADFKSQRALLEAQLLIEKQTDPTSGFLTRVSPKFAKDALLTDQANKILRMTEALKGADEAFKEAEKAAAAMVVPVAESADALNDVGKAAKTAAKELSEVEKQKKRLTEQTDEFIKSLTREIEEIGKTEKEMRALSIARALEIAQTEDQKKEILALAAVREKALNIDKQKELTKELINLNKQTEHEINLLGLKGAAREQAILAYELEAIAADFLAKGIEGTNEALEEYLRLRRELAAGQNAFAKEAQETQRLANNLEAVAGMLGPGGLGSVLQGVLNLEVKFKDGETLKISEAVAKEFPKLAQVISDVFAGAQVGQQVNSFFESLGVRSNNTGAKIGGAVGGTVGGAVGGPAGQQIGSIVGAIYGAILGGIIAGTPRASATISIISGQATQTAVEGNRKKLRQVATGLANGLIKGLTDVARQLGGELGGAVSLSIGQRKNKFTVDPTGRGLTKGVPTFATEAEAVAFAMRNAIAQGAITGISAGAQALIRASGDLTEQVQKALDFDNVAKDLMREINPLQAELDELGSEFDRLSRIFDEAGAGVAERAQLEELFAIRRQKAIFERERPAREKEIELLEAQGKAVEALAASRLLELAAMDEGLRAIQSQIFAQQDVNTATQAVIDAQSALRDAFNNEISRIEKEIEQREKNIESLESSFKDQARVFENTSDLFKTFAQSVREFASTLVPLNGSGRSSLAALQKRFAQIAALAAGGDTTAMGQFSEVGGALRDAIIANAPDKATMTRQLIALQAQADAVASEADTQASMADHQLEVAIAQRDALIAIEQAAIDQLRLEIDATTAMVGQLIEIKISTISVQTAIADLTQVTRELGEAQQRRDNTLLQLTNSRLAEVTTSLNVITPSAPPAMVLPDFSNVIQFPLINENARPGGGGNEFDFHELLRINAFANGGMHSGGLRIVGEGGPELEATGPSRIYNANQLGTMMGGGDAADEIKAMRAELKNAMFQIAKNTGKQYELLDRWNGDGLPPERIVG